MNRARTFDPATALGQVVELFASKGYSETSMEDIVQTTGVSRYGLYGTFGNKRELFEQALEQYAEGMGKRSFLRLLEPGASVAHIRARKSGVTSDLQRRGQCESRHHRRPPMAFVEHLRAG